MDRKYSDLLILLSSGINQRLMYFDKHPNVQKLARRIQGELAEYYQRNKGRDFQFGVHQGKFIRHGKYLVGPSITGRALIRCVEFLDGGGLRFRMPMEVNEILSFLRLGAELREDVGGREHGRRLMERYGLEHVDLLEPYVKDAPLDEEPAAAEELPEHEQDPRDLATADFSPLLQVYQALYDTVGSAARAVKGDTRLDLDLARQRGEALVTESGSGALDVMQFIRYPDYDSYTIGHSVRVAALAALVGREMGWPAAQCSELATAGLLHDLGKGLIPDEILFKPDQLDPDERRIMERHPILGTRVLLANGENSLQVLTAAWGHHLRHDGGGYPAMADGFRNSAAAQVIHVCDVFEALTATRPYKLALSPRRAYEIMLADGGGFHPTILAALIRSMGLYPPGSEVRLTDNRRAVVVARGPDLESPQVRVIREADGTPLGKSSQPAVQLSPGGLGVKEFLTVGLDDAQLPDGESLLA